MRIAVLNWRDSEHPEAGGAELYCHEAAKHIVAAGHTVTYVTARAPGTAARTQHPDGYPVVRRGNRYTVYPAVLWWLVRHRRTVDAVVDSQNGIPFFAPLALRRRTPVVLVVYHVHQEQFALYFSRPMAAVGRWLESTVARRIYGRRAIAAISPSTRAAVRSRLRLRGPIRLTPCGLGATGAATRTRSDVPTIVAVGRLVPHKRVHLLVEAMRDVIAVHGSVRLDVVGDGPERERLQELATGLGLAEHVVFHGRTTDEQRDRLLTSAWLMVNPTVGEGWGMSVLEANQVGVPALAYRVDGVRDSIVDGVTGWLVEPTDALAPAVAGALTELGDPQQARRRESSTRAWAAAFTWESTADGLLCVLEEERQRLQRSPERRSSSDLMTVVEISDEDVPAGWAPAFRAGDGMLRDADGVRILLHGIDHAAVGDVLVREGIHTEAVASGRVHVAVAGQQESLVLTAGAPLRERAGAAAGPR